MQRTGYQLLGFAVWQGAKWYVRRRYARTAKALAAGGVVLGVGAAAAVAAAKKSAQGG